MMRKKTAGGMLIGLALMVGCSQAPRQPDPPVAPPVAKADDTWPRLPPPSPPSPPSAARPPESTFVAGGALTDLPAFRPAEPRPSLRMDEGGPRPSAPEGYGTPAPPAPAARRPTPP